MLLNIYQTKTIFENNKKGIDYYYIDKDANWKLISEVLK